MGEFLPWLVNRRPDAAEPYRFEATAPAVENLGSCHIGYGVEGRHFAPAGRALLWTLEQDLGDVFTGEVRDAWHAAYTALAGIMTGGMQQRTPAAPEPAIA